MSRYNKDLGDFGENTAATFLKNRCYKILARNYTSKFGELDIVAINPEKDTIVFIEVKTRRSKKYGSAAMSINRSKIQKIIKSGEQYALENPSDCNYRFDVIEIYFNSSIDKVIEINHIKNAFYDLNKFS